MELQSSRWRPHQQVRVIAIGIARRRVAGQDDEILVMWVPDDSGAVKGARPPGGGVEFGELAADAVAREFREEFGTAIEVVGMPAVLENLFTHEEAAGHEVVFAYPVRLKSEHLYARNEIRVDDGCGEVALCSWHPVRAFVDGEVALYPEGIIEVLRQLLPPE